MFAWLRRAEDRRGRGAHWGVAVGVDAFRHTPQVEVSPWPPASARFNEGSGPRLCVAPAPHANVQRARVALDHHDHMCGIAGRCSDTSYRPQLLMPKHEKGERGFPYRIQIQLDRPWMSKARIINLPSATMRYEKSETRFKICATRRKLV